MLEAKSEREIELDRASAYQDGLLCEKDKCLRELQTEAEALRVQVSYFILFFAGNGTYF